MLSCKINSEVRASLRGAGNGVVMAYNVFVKNADENVKFNGYTFCELLEEYIKEEVPVELVDNFRE